MFQISAWEAFQCDGRRDGLYVDVTSQCQKFYICQNEAAYSYTCPPGMLFDMRARACGPEIYATCPQDGLQVAAASPSFSKGGFNNQKRGLYHGECTKKPDGFYADMYTKCRQFYECVRGVKHRQMACKSGKLFDESLMACVPETTTNCSPSAKPIKVESRQIKFFFPGHMNTQYGNSNDSQ